MKDKNYENVVAFLTKAMEMLQCASDEYEEFGSKVVEKSLGIEAKNLLMQVNRLKNKSEFHQRTLKFSVRFDLM